MEEGRNYNSLEISNDLQLTDVYSYTLKYIYAHTKNNPINTFKSPVRDTAPYHILLSITLNSL